MDEPGRPIEDTIPQGTACLNCRYDLAGLPWASRCPECGYRGPTHWPTGDLHEAHPAFIRTTHKQLRGLMTADWASLLGLACLVLAYLVGVLFRSHPAASSLAEILILVGGVMLIAGVLTGVLFAGYVGWRHRRARPSFDQPRRITISMAFWWCVAPIGLTFVLTIISGGTAACLLIVTGPISIASGVMLYFAMFEHATSVIERCQGDIRWTTLEKGFGYGSLPCFVMIGVSLPFVPWASPSWLAAGLAMLVITRLLRLRRAARCVATLLTWEGQPHALPGS